MFVCLGLNNSGFSKMLCIGTDTGVAIPGCLGPGCYGVVVLMERASLELDLVEPASGFDVYGIQLRP